MTPWKHPGSVIDHIKPAHGGRNTVLRKVTNLPLQVPSEDWSAVAVGAKRMFRTYTAPVVPKDTEYPRPCLLYSSHRPHRGQRKFQKCVGVLHGVRVEPLGAISVSDIAAEGFGSLEEFRWYWQRRYRSKGWRPWEMVTVYEVEPLGLSDDALEWFNKWIWQQLFEAEDD